MTKRTVKAATTPPADVVAETPIDEPFDNTTAIIKLYNEFGKDLLAIKPQMAALYKTLSNPMFDDVELEIMYMLIRKHRPVSVVEVSAGCGWSTSWILSALRDNHIGRLVSCEFTDYAAKHIPLEIHDNRLEFLVGDVRTMSDKFPKHIDFLLEDSAHDDKFNKWFADEFYPRMNTNSVLCVHDVFMLPHPRHSDATVLFDWVQHKGLKLWTPGKIMDAQWDAIQKKRSELGIANIHSCDVNPLAIVEIVK